MYHLIPADARSFLEIDPESDFPIQNLPYGVFSRPGEPRRIGVAIGDWVLDLHVLAQQDLLAAGKPQWFAQDALNDFADAGRHAWRAVRASVASLLDAGNPRLRDDTALRSRALLARQACTMHLPFRIGGYTDFYSSEEHATNVGRLFRDPASALTPNWKHVPIGYNGRASSVILSGQPVVRPMGQILASGAQTPVWSPCRQLDFELETAFFVGGNTELGLRLDTDQAQEHVFGMVLMNDWSARDIQRWEYVPLGPFQAKAFATSISAWVVTLDALQPFKVPAPVQDPSPLPYLHERDRHGYDIELTVRLRPESGPQTTVAISNSRHLYWTMAQQLAHHTSSGCNVRSGDLMGSGTISGPSRESLGSLLEITRNGRDPLPLAGGVQRTFLEDGDEVTMSGHCRKGGLRLGFGEVSARVLSARATHHPSPREFPRPDPTQPGTPA